ncbi:hypothetical protein [Polaromonas sp. DSR2-3-2]
MSKLFKLKKWLTVPDAAKHLAIVFGEEVTEADVLRFGIDGHLKLSVHLVNGAYARPCFPVKIEEIEWDEMSLLDGKQIIKIPRGGRIWQDHQGCFQVKRHVSALDGDVWDLPMNGGERIDVEYRYQQLTNGPEVTTVSLEGVLVASINGELHEIQSHFGNNENFKKDDLKKPFLHPDNFHPAGALPDDSVFVVRISALTEFIQSVNEEPTNTAKPLGTTERNNLLKLVIGMAVKGYSHDPAAKKSATPKEIADDLAALGISIDPDTVRKYLKESANTVLPAKARQP